MTARLLRIGKLRLAPHEPVVVAPITDRTSRAVLVRAARAGLDLFEARVDLFRDRTPKAVCDGVARARELLPVLATVRSHAEGGGWDEDERARLALYRALLPSADAVDVELSATIRAEVVQTARRAKRLVVLSHHDFARTPSPAALERIVERGFDARADVVKIAARVRDDSEVARLAALFARHPGRALVVIGMGEHGVKTRLLFPALGSRFTFAALGRGTAPGQLELAAMQRELRFLYPAYAARLSPQRPARRA